ncbi:rhomboid-like protein [Streptomyces sp. NPDC088747]|uniref:rhomboid-like protein n=1 Tax=Streptomyces sp. NPDC088747 TaxID=3365886 RepID=UPI0037F4A6EB
MTRGWCHRAREAPLETLISEGALSSATRHGMAPESAVNTLDVGVGYALAGGGLLVHGVPPAVGRGFADLGHFGSVVIDLGCCPPVGRRGKAWNPKETTAAHRG